MIGSKQFYKSVFAIALPITVQNGISNVVNMLDNLMVGRIGTEQLSGVSIVNDLIFVYQLCLFGAIGG
ncbi:MAG: MATE family efflux transporter, partial [Lachnospiraceae bacterium]|nr:MATE family efflux transporter [Lachnospiraceae bacterium]